MAGPGKKKYTVADCIGANCTKPNGMRSPKVRGGKPYSKKDNDKTNTYIPESTGGIVKQKEETTNLEVVKHGDSYSQKLYSGTNTAEAKKKYSVADTQVPVSKKKTVEVEETESTAPKTYSKVTTKDAVVTKKKKIVR